MGTDKNITFVPYVHMKVGIGAEIRAVLFVLATMRPQV